MNNASSYTRTALASLLLGTALIAAPAQAGEKKADHYAAKAAAAMEDGKSQRAVENAERAVLVSPRDPEMRVLLGKAYLDAGRMVSARDSLGIAVELGDTGPRTALMLALAQIGSGDSRAAIATIDAQGSQIRDAERGLALALAGQPARGVEIISSAIRHGDNSAKARQNLAYAFALDGRWREARMMAAQDVPADVIDQRIEQWATTARPEHSAIRVANLLGTRAVADNGQPVALALAPEPAPVAMAAAEPEQPAPVPVASKAEPVKVAVAPAPTPAKAEPTPARVAVAATPAPVAEPAKPVEKVAVSPSSAPRTKFVSNEIVQDAPEAEKVAAAPAPVTKSTPKTAAKQDKKAALAVAKPAPAPLPKPATNGTHVAQLGSFNSAADAQRGWKVFQSRYSNLAGQKPVITKVNVDGVDYYRVAAGGFDSDGAYAMCRAVKASGHGCLPITKPASQRLAKAD